MSISPEGGSALTSSEAEKRTNLDGLGGLQGLLWGDPHLPLPQQLLGEVGDVPAGDGDVFDAATDDVAFSLHTGELSRDKKGGGGNGQGQPHPPQG